MAGQFPTYGSRRVTNQLRRSRYRFTVNRKRVRRILVKKELLRPTKRQRRRTTDSQHPILAIQTWSKSSKLPTLTKFGSVTSPTIVYIKRTCTGPHHGCLYTIYPRLVLRPYT
ncbi:MAG: IS3 family transposase [Anaerolineales bacterium]